MERDLEVYQRYAEDLVRYATALVGPDEAADVVEDAALACFAAPGFGTAVNQRAYLYRAVLTHAQMARRSDARRRQREDIVARRDVPVAADGPSVDARRMLADLTHQQRAVIYLAYWHDMAPGQIAQVLEVSEGTVRKQLARARDHLRRTLDDDRS